LSRFGAGVRIGRGAALGEFSYIGATGGVDIGDNVIMGQYVSFHAQEHVFSDPCIPIKDQGTTEKGIVVGDNCWVGARVTFLDGAQVGTGCVIAAGSVVRGHFPSNSIIGGIPAKVIDVRETT
jgi:acetyltransferase-like isoleucine patch superfamily enzyme